MKKIATFLYAILKIILKPLSQLLYANKSIWLINCYIGDECDLEYSFNFAKYLTNNQKYLKIRCISANKSVNNVKPHSLKHWLLFLSCDYMVSFNDNYCIPNNNIKHGKNNKSMVVLLYRKHYCSSNHPSYLQVNIEENNTEIEYSLLFLKILDKYVDSIKNVFVKSNPTYLIFTADDYGRNQEAINGINETLKKGIVQQTSYMTNTKSSHNCTITNTFPIVLHFNFLEGYKYNQNNNETYSYDVNNNNSLSYRLVNKRSFYRLSKKDKEDISIEISKQIDNYKKLIKNKYYAFDSHGHIHNKLPIAKLIIAKCKKENFKVARIPSNCKKNHLLFDLTYKKYVISLYKKNFVTTDYFCSCYDLIHLNLSKFSGKVIEIMTHPYQFKSEIQNRRDVDFDIIKKYISKYNVSLIDFIDLIKMKDNKK